MKATVVVLVLVLVDVGTPQCISNNDNKKPPTSPDLSHITPFGLDLLKQFSPEGTNSNLFFSPYSIWNALVLAYFGAAGNTQKELEAALRLSDKPDTLATYRALSDLYSRRQRNSKYVMDVANRVYVNTSVAVKPCVRRVLQNETHILNFNQANEAAATINQFVRLTTRGKIAEVVVPGALLGASMVLVNAAYFKGLWLHQFNITSWEEFHVTPTTSQQTETMTRFGDFKYGVSDTLGAKILELPYKGEALSMFVLLPNEKISGQDCTTKTPIDCLVHRLNAASLTAALASIKEQNVHVQIPKFTLEQTFTDELIQALNALNIHDLFSPEAANLTHYDPSGQLFLNKGLHKAVVEVNEEGSEAAGATAFLAFLSINYAPPNFVCNRPFLFFIYDKQTNNILFMGILRHPEGRQ